MVKLLLNLTKGFLMSVRKPFIKQNGGLIERVKFNTPGASKTLTRLKEVKASMGASYDPNKLWR